ncbi:MAG: acyl dehydratase [Sneathiella sp.]|jgi:3-hydroxybutyryl-CoA dehydratase|uniref:MaoC family dehydratase n=1 Tax=Sneathiella sp. TaxID=1964365 RepID=UPI000C697646|nr:MaoC family dehydratase [Sneathiella sp.]MAL78665.1 acyl dehydratase [Sneathiella sp.]|tara:strand:- start:209 stop:640 length:432 start_codon:yes stop_codon:yes gene_type:complete
MSVYEELHGYFLEDLKVGMTAVYAKTITEADILLYAGVSGDTNPVHLNAEFAEKTIFKERIAHGMLSAGLLSTVFGTKLPGPGAIYMNQSLNFKAPVCIGDTVVASVSLREISGKKVTFDCACTIGETVVLDGEATLMVSRRP